MADKKPESDAPEREAETMGVPESEAPPEPTRGVDPSEKIEIPKKSKEKAGKDHAWMAFRYNYGTHWEEFPPIGKIEGTEDVLLARAALQKKRTRFFSAREGEVARVPIHLVGRVLAATHGRTKRKVAEFSSERDYREWRKTQTPEALRRRAEKEAKDGHRFEQVREDTRSSSPSKAEKYAAGVED